MSDWPELERFLRTDPRDVGYEEAVAILPIYADLLAAGQEAASRYPGVAARLAACPPCAEDLAGLLAAVTGNI
jgi:hypothetical protein